VLGDVSRIEEGYFQECVGVDKVIRISRPYKLVSREFQPGQKVVMVGSAAVGGGKPVIMAGPCSVESESQLMTMRPMWPIWASPFTRGAYKPRTSPYSFQGMDAKAGYT